MPGKVKKDRSASQQRANPIGNASPVASPEVTRTLQEAGTVFERLSSTNPAIRRAACDAMAFMVLERRDSVSVLLREGVMQRLMPAICDADLGVCVAATGAFRNLSISGGSEACEHMAKRDILTLLLAQLTKGVNAADPATSHQLLTQIFALLSNIGENNEGAIRIMTSSNLLPTICQYMRPDMFPSELNTEAAQLLLLLSEENATVCNQLMSSAEFQQFLGSLISQASTAPLLRVLASGIVFHSLKYSSNGAASIANPTDSLRAVVSTLVAALEIDPIASAAELRAQTAEIEAKVESKMAARIASSVADEPSEAEMAESIKAVAAAVADGALTREPAVEVSEAMEDTAPEDVHAPATSEDTMQEAALDAEPWSQPLSAWRQRTLAVQTAVELLANICSMDDAAEQLDDSGWDADDADVPASAGGAENMTDVPAVFRVALEAGVLARLLARCTPPPAAMSSALHELLPSSEATQSINAVYSCATKSLTALNNMMLVLPAVALGDLSSVWTHAFALASELNAAHEAFSAEQAQSLQSAADPDSSDSVPLGVLTLSACTDLMWSILRKNIAVGVTKAHIGVLINCARGGKTAALRLHTVGALSLIAASRTHDDFVVLFASVFLQLLSDASLPVVSEALNAIFDLFSEDNMYTQAIQQLNLLSQLSAFLPVFTQRINAVSRSLDRELLSQVKESRLNLSRFIKYKQNHL